MNVDHLDRRARHVLAPQIVDEAVDSNRPVGVEQQTGQQRPLLRRPERNRRPVSLDLERPEQARVDGRGRHHPRSRGRARRF